MISKPAETAPRCAASPEAPRNAMNYLLWAVTRTRIEPVRLTLFQLTDNHAEKHLPDVGHPSSWRQARGARCQGHATLTPGQTRVRVHLLPGVMKSQHP